MNEIKLSKAAMPPDASYAQAMKTSYGEKIKLGNATIVDWLAVIYTAETMQKTWNILNANN
jgi:hypothetical protein